MKRLTPLTLILLFAVALAIEAITARAQVPPPVTQPTQPALAYVDVAYQDGSTKRLFNLNDAEIAAVNAAIDRRKPPTPAPPPRDPNGVYVEAGQSWVAGIRAAKPGQTVYLAPAATYTGEFLNDPNLRLDDLRVETPDGTPKAEIRVTRDTALAVWNAKAVRFTNIRFVADEPTGKAIHLWGASQGILFRDCEISGFAVGVAVEGQKHRPTGIEFHRCRFADCTSTTGDAHGVFLQAADRVGFYNCLFLGTGQKPGGGVKKLINATRCHDIYGVGDCGPITIDSCAFVRCAGPAVQMRSGGTIRNSHFLDNPVHLTFGYVNGAGPLHLGGVTGVIEGNTFVGQTPLGDGHPGGAIQLANFTDVAIRNNRFASDVKPKAGAGTFPYPIKVDVCGLDTNNPHRGLDIKAGRLLVEGNSGTWVDPKANKGRVVGGMVWVNPQVDAYLKTAASRRSAIAATFTIQDKWTPLDVAAVRAEVAAN